VVTRRAHVRKRGEDRTGFDTVLVPLDGSEFAERALLYVERLQRTDADVILLRAVASASELAGAVSALDVHTRRPLLNRSRSIASHDSRRIALRNSSRIRRRGRSVVLIR